jgi:hypothetical protein
VVAKLQPLFQIPKQQTEKSSQGCEATWKIWKNTADEFSTINHTISNFDENSLKSRRILNIHCIFEILVIFQV